MEDTQKRENYKIYGELLTAYGYSVPEKSKSTTVNNYYTGEDITIPLDPELSAIDNAKKYFDYVQDIGDDNIFIMEYKNIINSVLSLYRNNE